MINQPAVAKRAAGRSIAQTIMRTSAANFIIMLLGTLTSIATARLFGVEGKGMFSAILFWPTLLAGVVGFGLPTSLIYNMKRSADRAAEYVRAAFVFQLAVSLLVGAVAWFGLPVWLGNYPADVIDIARWYTILTLPMLLAVNLLAALAQSMDQFGLYNGLRLYIPLSNLLGLLALWGLGILSLRSGAFVFCATSLTVVCWSLFRQRRELFGRLRGMIDRAVYRALFGYGARVFGVELLGTLYTQCDKLIILSLLTPRDFGLYTVVYTLSRMFNIVQTAVTNVIFPKVTGLGRELVIATVARAFRLSFVLMAASLVPGVIIGRFMLGLLFGEEFLEASVAFYLLSVECIGGGGSWILASSFNALGRPGLVTVRQAIALAVTVALFFVFTPLYGLNGIALALLIGAAVRIVITLAAMRLAFKTPLSAVLYDRGDVRFLRDSLARILRRGQTDSRDEQVR